MRKAKLAGAAMTMLAAGLARADGPVRWNRLLVQGDRALLDAPRGNMYVELDRLPALATTERYVSPDDTLDAQTVRAIALLTMTPTDAAWAASGWAQLGPSGEGGNYAYAWNGKAREWRRRQTRNARSDVSRLPPALRLSAEGRHDDDVGRPDLAYAALRELLALPADQRFKLDLAAQYRLGRLALRWQPLGERLDPATQFALVRTLARDGDPDGMGCRALGQQARLALDAGDLLRALDLYRQQYAAQDPTAAMSIYVTARAALEMLDMEGSVDETVTHPDMARAIAAYVVSYIEDAEGSRTAPRVRRFTSLLAKAGRERYRDFADRLAMAAYEAGDLDETRAWLTLCDGRSEMDHWLKAKVLLTEGKTDRAAEELERALIAFPAEEDWEDRDDALEYGAAPYWVNRHPRDRAAGELAILRLGQKRYAEALRLFLSSGRFLDAAYVAERVMTLDELRVTIDAGPAKEGQELMRDLLAARLGRAGKYAEEARYLPPDLAVRAARYAELLAQGRDANGEKEERAFALMEAARIARWDGEHLLATMLEPDWNALDLNSELEPAIMWRVESPVRWRVAVASDDEKRRVRASAVDGSRWHYRYVAADLAWEACGLLPDNSPRLAAWLVEAGRWIADKDARAADRFYRAIVKRCPNDPLGVAAKKRRWFPATQPAR